MAKKVKKTSKKATTKKTAKKKTAKKAAKKKTAKKTVKKKTAKKAAKKKTVKKAVKKATKKASKKKTSAKKAVKKKTAVRKSTSRKKKSGLSVKELQHFKDILLEKRREIIGDVSHMENEALKKSRLEAGGDLSSMPIHMADMGTDNFEQEFSLGLMDSERKLLVEINSALVRIFEGKYGLCEGTGKEIPKPRLEAVPWARYCIEYATMVEKGQVIEGEKIYDEEDEEDLDDYEGAFEDEDDDEYAGFDLLDYEEMEDEENEAY